MGTGKEITSVIATLGVQTRLPRQWSNLLAASLPIRGHESTGWETGGTLLGEAWNLDAWVLSQPWEDGGVWWVAVGAGVRSQDSWVLSLGAGWGL